MRVDGDAKHLGADATIEALHHAIRLRRVRLGVAVLRTELGTDLGEGRGEAAAVVGQHVGEAEGKSGRGLAQGPRQCLGRRRPAMALFSVSSSLTARCTERERRSMATKRYRLRRSPLAVCSLGRCLMSMWKKPRS